MRNQRGEVVKSMRSRTFEVEVLTRALTGNKDVWVEAGLGAFPTEKAAQVAAAEIFQQPGHIRVVRVWSVRTVVSRAVRVQMKAADVD